jgi:hypothetical protein
MRVRELTTKCGLDWGSSNPGCVLWAVALPDNHAHVYDELKFVKLSVREVADAIREKSLSEWKLGKMPPIFCDPALRIKTGQIGEDFLMTFARYKVALTPVSNNRQVGWQRLHEALALDPATKTPWLTFHPRCKYLIRTLPMMLQDEHDPEDCDSTGDDHGADSLRYLLQGGLRAGSKANLIKPDPPGSWGQLKRYLKRTAA